jgi:hypothetical protein
MGRGLGRIDRESSRHADTSVSLAPRSKYGSLSPPRVPNQHSKWTLNKLSRSTSRLHGERAIKI